MRIQIQLPSDSGYGKSPSQSEATAIIDAIAKASTEPCLQSFPDGLQVQYCSPADSFLCPRGTFCQIGAGPQHTFCCPMIGKPNTNFKHVDKAKVRVGLESSFS